MNVITIINSFLLAGIISLLTSGVVLNIRYTHNNIYKRYLLTMLSFWIIILFNAYVKFFTDEGINEYNLHVISTRMLLMGIPSFLTIVSYPIVILNANLLKFKWWCIVVSPIALFIAIYFLGYYIIDENPFKIYLNYSDITNNIGTAAVLLRLMLITGFFIYIVIFLANIWRVVPLYNKYIEEHYADCDYNVDWVRRLIIYISLVSISFFAMVLTNSEYINLIYLISVAIMFGYIVDVSLFYKSTDEIEPLKIGWSFKRKWYIIDNNTSNEPESIPQDVVSSKWDAINRWMQEESPYTRTDFSIDNILDNFPHITHYELTLLLKEKGETFQSLVRSYRINHACDIVRNSGNKISSKQLYSQVGFSHYSSFSRSFISVLGISPSEYIKSIKNSD